MASHSTEAFEYAEDWTELLIQTVKSKPAIYNKEIKEHSDRNNLTRLWGEVCETVVQSWHELTPEQRTIKGKEIQQRWRNLRTCFKRELNKQNKPKSGPMTKKRRKYVYFDQLLFLLPTMGDKDPVSEPSPPQSDEENSECELDHTEGDQLRIESKKNQQLTKKGPSYEESLLKILQERSSADVDEDRLFLLSLVPSFKKMSDAQKIEAKMQFLAVIGRISQSNPSTQTFHAQCPASQCPNCTTFTGNFPPHIPHNYVTTSVPSTSNQSSYPTSPKMEVFDE